ncbi:MAG: hypothetical protein KKI09_14930, partial [Spirochaetes bacterium]|nr:hypothetical protein [Spirochaetota bacterium]
MKKQKNLAWLVSLILATSLLLTACPDPINTGTDAETESSEQVEAGLAALAEDDLDGALDSFKLALVANPDNVDAQVYVSFLEIAALSTDTDMIDLMSNRIGVQNYPSTLNDVVGLSWISEYTYNGTRWVDHDFDPETPLIEESYTEIYNFPALQMPDEAISFFPEGALTGEWFPEIYMINLAANILTRNPTGFNTVVDNIKALSLGSNLNTIISMIEELDSDTRVEIPANLYSDMLTAMYGENPVPASLTLTVGKPELMILAAYLQTCQALVQYVASVDFSYDIDGVIEALLASNLMVVADEAAALQSIFDATPGFFFTDLLTTRSEADRTASKASLLAAMTTAIDAYNLYKEQLLDSSSWYRTSMQTMAIEFGETAPSTAEIQDMIDTMYQPMIDEAELVKTAIQNNTSYD